MRADFDYLSVEIEVKDDKLSGKAKGYLADAIQPFVDAFCNTMNSLKVIHRHADGSLRHNLYNPPQPTKAGMRAIMRKLMEPIYKTVFPATANLAITHKCQAKCVHCSADPFKGPGKVELSTDELKSVIDQSLALGANIVIFTGGDPFCRPDLYELAKYVDKDKANMMMFTNGLGLTDENVKRLAESGMQTINVSIDHVDPKIHNELRGIPHLYEKAVEGAMRAKAAGILVGVSTYATGEKLNDGSLERLLQMAQKEGFNEVTVFDCIPSGKFLKHTELVLKPADRKRIVELCEQDGPPHGRHLPVAHQLARRRRLLRQLLPVLHDRLRRHQPVRLQSDQLRERPREAAGADLDGDAQPPALRQAPHDLPHANALLPPQVHRHSSRRLHPARAHRGNPPPVEGKGHGEGTGNDEGLVSFRSRLKMISYAHGRGDENPGRFCVRREERRDAQPAQEKLPAPVV